MIINRILEATSLNPRRTRVCIITAGHWSAVQGGIQYQVKCLVDEMVKNDGFEIFYLARIIDPLYHPKGYTVAAITGIGQSLRSAFFLDALKLTSLLRTLRPDVIYQQGLNSYTGIAAHYPLNQPCKLIFHIASDNDVIPLRYQKVSWHRGPAWIEKRVGEYGMRHADFIVAQTEKQQELLRNYYNLNPSLLVRNFHPLPKESIQKDSHPIKVVWVANFKPVKRPEMFVQLAEDLDEIKDARFIMIGRPGSGRQYAELHRRIEKTSNLVYLGELPIDQVNEILSAAHIFVNTSTVEGFPNTYIQAWMRRMPVVSAGINPDGILEKEEIGFSDGTYAYLRDSVRRLLHDGPLRKQMGNRAQSYAFKRFSTSNVTPLLDLMRSC